jgi:hypothetical protein
MAHQHSMPVLHSSSSTRCAQSSATAIGTAVRLRLPLPAAALRLNKRAEGYTAPLTRRGRVAAAIPRSPAIRTAPYSAPFDALRPPALSASDYTHEYSPPGSPIPPPSAPPIPLSFLYQDPPYSPNAAVCVWHTAVCRAAAPRRPLAEVAPSRHRPHVPAEPEGPPTRRAPACRLTD